MKQQLPRILPVILKSCDEKDDGSNVNQPSTRKSTDQELQDILRDYKASLKQESRLQIALEQFFYSDLAYSIFQLGGTVRRKVKYLVTSASISFRFKFDDLMTASTIYVLFYYDLKYLVIPKALDSAFDVISSICFGLFILELLLNCWVETTYHLCGSFSDIFVVEDDEEEGDAQDESASGSGMRLDDDDGRDDTLQKKPKYKGYLFSFYFWSDLLSICSLFVEIEWIAKPLGLADMTSVIGDESQKFRGIVKKAGAVMRMTRLARIIRLYKIASSKRNQQRKMMHQQQQAFQGELAQENMVDLQVDGQEQNLAVGSQLTDTITKQVMVGVILTLMGVAFCEYSEVDETIDQAVNYLHTYNIQSNGTINETMLETALGTFASFMGTTYSLLYLEIQPSKGILVNQEEAISFSRTEELQTVELVQSEYITKAIFSLHQKLFDASLRSLGMTLVVIFWLLVGLIQFNLDVQKLVLKPIGRITGLLMQISDDPLQEITLLEHNNNTNAEVGDYELRLLESTLVKVTGLLRVGFGVAGSGIISQNILTKQSKAGADIVNPCREGDKVYAIIGFCDIHHFDYVTEKLEGEILTFVNNIASIVHEAAFQWGGQCNKNLGNAFVILWRIGNESDVLSLIGILDQTRALYGSPSSTPTGTITPSKKRKAASPKGTPTSRNIKAPGGVNDNEGFRVRGTPKKMKGAPSLSSMTHSSVRLLGDQIDLKRIPGLDIVADMAVISYLKIIAGINTEQTILSYRGHPKLCSGQYSKPKKPFKVRMGFGLHTGWAIEGAVGSTHKVDATYLSPHVNMAARMETASRQYGVPLLLTGSTYQLLSDKGKSKCRQIDTVTVKGSNEPTDVYTYDCNQKAFKADKKKLSVQSFGGGDLCKNHHLYVNNTGGGELELPPGSLYYHDIWDEDKDLKKLHSHCGDEFMSTFKKAFQNYTMGNWGTAKDLLLECNELQKQYGGDGPSKSLLRYMQQTNYVCPKEWKGYRPLVNK